MVALLLLRAEQHLQPLGLAHSRVGDVASTYWAMDDVAGTYWEMDDVASTHRALDNMASTYWAVDDVASTYWALDDVASTFPWSRPTISNGYLSCPAIALPTPSATAVAPNPASELYRWSGTYTRPLFSST